MGHRTVKFDWSDSQEAAWMPREAWGLRALVPAAAAALLGLGRAIQLGWHRPGAAHAVWGYALTACDRHLCHWLLLPSSRILTRNGGKTALERSLQRWGLPCISYYNERMVTRRQDIKTINIRKHEFANTDSSETSFLTPRVGEGPLSYNALHSFCVALAAIVMN